MATLVEHLARFVHKASYDMLSDGAREDLKVRVLDGLGCALGAIHGEPIRALRAYITNMGGTPHCTLIGGGRTSPDRAALYNGALVRYLDFNDSYLAKGETCHPSDNIGCVLAASQYADRTGREFLAALALAYQIQCRLSDEAPVRAKGFDHTTQGAYAASAAVAKALGLSEEKTANAIAISGTAFNALRVTRTGALSNWKGLASPNSCFGATHAALLAMHGITGPLEVFEGNKGFMDAIAEKFVIDWEHEDLERVTRTIVKRYNAEIHSQATIEGVLELKRDEGFDAKEIERIDVETFDVAYHIIGGGEEGDKTLVATKEQADHSLQYMIAAAMLDGRLMPEEYAPERIVRSDIQTLLRRVFIRPLDAYSVRFPSEMPCRITVTLADGRQYVKEKNDYEGFFTRPMRWDTVVQKFRLLTNPVISREHQERIIGAVRELETMRIRKLFVLLEILE
ncbi:MAG: MmgE/PrpD family protein [Acidobacteriota bacterium]